jgi:AbrB family looped-hinge helix DNA binding protein
MTVMEAKITSKGQVTLPIELRARLGLEPGDRVMFIEQADGRFTIQARSGTFADLRGILSSKVKRRPTSAEIEQWIDEARSRALPRTVKKRRP